MPDNLTQAFLPPCSPELNVIERGWLHLKERYLSHRVWPTMTTDSTLSAKPGTD